jgi:NAD(P)-dependent dehydrogenase (short-subunit alcohol dehydrogenase family)
MRPHLLEPPLAEQVTAEFGVIVAFLRSQQASYCTGSTGRVDGGRIKTIA